MNSSISAAVVSPPVFCDWLNVTFPVGSRLWDDVSEFLRDSGSSSKRFNDGRLEFRLPAAEWGNVLLTESTSGWSSLSASGGSCSALRSLGVFGEFLATIGSHTHTVTRVDATLDFYVDADPVIKALCARYPPDSLVYLTRKGVTPDYYLKPTLWGPQSGTFYAGDRRKPGLSVIARAYDKRLAVYDITGVDSGPRLRYEVVARKRTGVTLRDAFEPAPLFWHFAAPALLNRPPGIPDWSPGVDSTWSPGARVSTPYSHLRRRVEISADLEALKNLADQLPGRGRLTLARLLLNHLGLRDAPLPEVEAIAGD